VVLAWALWLLVVLTLAAVPVLDRLCQAGRPDLVQLTPDTAFPIVAMVSGATVGAVLAGRRPWHPVGWLLLGVGLGRAARSGLRRRYDAARTVEAFSTRLREQVDLATLSAELLAVVDQTVQPTRTSLWLRPERP
jgi:hypothetical protein